MSSFSQHNNKSYNRLSLTNILQERSLTLSLACWLSLYPEYYWNDDNEYQYIKSQVESIIPCYDDIKEDNNWLPNNNAFILPKATTNTTTTRIDTRLPINIKDNNNIKIYTDYDVIKNEVIDYLSSNITIVDNEDDADFLFLTRHVKEFLKINKILNQFPYEGGIVSKDLLPLTVRGYCYKYDSNGQQSIPPKWWLPCYDLSTEFHFLSVEYKRREKYGLSNKWIIKPAQGTRGLGHIIVDDKAGLIGIANAAPLLKSFDNPNSETNNTTTDRIAQLLVEKPLLVNGYKFDLRVFVVVRSFIPFDAYVHNLFYARLANKVYDVTKVKDNEVMLTVNCYSEDEDIANKQQRLTRNNLKIALENEYKDSLNWEQDSIESMYTLLTEFFGGVARSIGSWPNSRAYYAVDIIFDHSDEIPMPYLVECNFMGDWHGMQNAFEPDDYHQWVNDILLSLASKDELDSSKFRKL